MASKFRRPLSARVQATLRAKAKKSKRVSSLYKSGRRIPASLLRSRTRA